MLGMEHEQGSMLSRTIMLCSYICVDVVCFTGTRLIRHGRRDSLALLPQRNPAFPNVPA